MILNHEDTKDTKEIMLVAKMGQASEPENWKINHGGTEGTEKTSEEGNDDCWVAPTFGRNGCRD
jgi:hypothetical protein